MSDVQNKHEFSLLNLSLTKRFAAYCLKEVVVLPSVIVTIILCYELCNK